MHSQLRAFAEVYACADSKAQFVRDFVKGEDGPTAVEYAGDTPAEVKAKEVRQPQVVELITTGRTEGVESELPTSVEEGATA